MASTFQLQLASILSSLVTRNSCWNLLHCDMIQSLPCRSSCLQYLQTWAARFGKATTGSLFSRRQRLVLVSTFQSVFLERRKYSPVFITGDSIPDHSWSISFIVFRKICAFRIQKNRVSWSLYADSSAAFLLECLGEIFQVFPAVGDGRLDSLVPEVGTSQSAMAAIVGPSAIAHFTAHSK